MCNDLRSRGVEDILIVAKDGLSGFSEAIATVFPQVDLQLCIIHQLRNNLKYVSKKEQAAVIVDLKKVYQAVALEEAELRFTEFRERWGSVYPLIARSWEKNWVELTAYFKYPEEIRRIIYTTNTIEGYHRQLRKASKTKTIYASDDALRKVIYLATMDISRRWTLAVHHWGKCLGTVHHPLWRSVDLTDGDLVSGGQPPDPRGLSLWFLPGDGCQSKRDGSSSTIPRRNLIRCSGSSSALPYPPEE